MGNAASGEEPVTEKAFPSTPGMPPPGATRSRHALSPRTICGKDIVLYRRPTARSRRWRMPAGTGCCRCRSASSNGDQVVCGYHGLVFNAAGRCTYMPAQKTINPSACVQSYPGRREAPPGLGLAGRSGARRSRPDPGLPLERRHGLGRRRRHLLQPEMRLPAGRRQSHGPDPRDLCPCRQHRRRRDHRHARSTSPTPTAPPP